MSRVYIAVLMLAVLSSPLTVLGLYIQTHFFHTLHGCTPSGCLVYVEDERDPAFVPEKGRDPDILRVRAITKSVSRAGGTLIVGMTGRKNRQVSADSVEVIIDSAGQQHTFQVKGGLTAAGSVDTQFLRKIPRELTLGEACYYRSITYYPNNLFPEKINTPTACFEVVE